MTIMKLSLFGTPRIERDGQTVHVDTRKAFALIAYLVAQGGYQSRDTLGALLWQDNDEAHVRGALRRTLSALNAALGGRGLLIEREAIAFNAAELWCDVTAFMQALTACGSHGHDINAVCTQCLLPLNEAISVYKGDFLQGFSLRDSSEFDLWQVQQAEYFRGLYAAGLEKLICLHEQNHHPKQAIALAQRWLALDPLHESAHIQLIRLYALSGQRSLALRQYHECVRILERELGVPPLAETTEMYQRVLNETIVPDRGSDVRPAYRDQPSAAPFALPFVGRDEALKTLNRLYRQRGVGTRIVVVEGEAGIGKSRLVAQFTEQHHAAGAQVMRLHGFESEIQFAYAPVIRSLREHFRHGADRLTMLAPHWRDELGRLLPELQPANTGTRRSPVEAGVQTRLYEAISHAVLATLAGDRRGILVVEDAHWADSATLEWLMYWLRRPVDAQAEFDIQMIIVWRSEEIDRSHRLHRLLVDVGRQDDSVSWITLPRLTQGDVERVVTDSALAVDEKTLRRLHEESEGLPLFIHEYVKLLHADPQLSNQTDWHIPTSIQELFQSHIAQVSPVAVQLLQAAAVIGRTFDLDLVQECSGRSDAETVDSAEELERRGLWHQRHSENDYSFSHEKIRAWIYDELSLGRKRLLHRRLAQAALNRVGHTDKRAASAAFIARHFHLGGQEERAAEFYYLAGCHARTLFAHLEALHHFEHSLALGYPDRVALYQRIGDAHAMLGSYHTAIAAYDAGIAHAMPERSVTLEAGLGRVFARLGDWTSAERCFQTALDLVLPDLPQQRVMLLTEWSLVRFRMGDIAHAVRLADRALSEAQASDQALSQAQAYNVLGILARHQGDTERALQLLEQSARLAATLDDASVQVAAQNNLALTCMDVGDHVRAQSLWEGALALSLRRGDQHHAAALHNHLSDLFHVLDQRAQARDHLKRAVTLFAQIGIDGTEMKPEIWKLTEW